MHRCHAEAGGIVEPFSRGGVIKNGTIAICGKHVFAKIREISAAKG